MKRNPPGHPQCTTQEPIYRQAARWCWMQQPTKAREALLDMAEEILSMARIKCPPIELAGLLALSIERRETRVEAFKQCRAGGAPFAESAVSSLAWQYEQETQILRHAMWQVGQREKALCN